MAVTEVAFSALGCDVAVASPDAELREYLARLFRHLPPPSGAGEPLRLDMDSSTTVAALVRRIDEHVIAQSPRLLIHGAAATAGDQAITIVGRSGSGKSTLVAALVEVGLGYLTDEFTSPDWETGVLEPYHRWLSIDLPSWGRLPHLEPALATAVSAVAGDQWQVDPEAIRPGAVATATPLRHLFFTTYAPDTPTTVEPMSRVEALLALVECTFRFHEHGARAFTALGRLASDADAHRLAFGDLGDAVDAVRQALTTPVAT